MNASTRSVKRKATVILTSETLECAAVKNGPEVFYPVTPNNLTNLYLPSKNDHHQEVLNEEKKKIRTFCEKLF
jgi:hypothetical protein